MPRVAIPRRQADLFRPAADLFDTATPAEPSREAVAEELARLLDQVASAKVLPFADGSAALAVELRVLSLSRRLGAEGEALAARFQAEMERLYSAGEA